MNEQLNEEFNRLTEIEIENEIEIDDEFIEINRAFRNVLKVYRMHVTPNIVDLQAFMTAITPKIKAVVRSQNLPIKFAIAVKTELSKRDGNRTLFTSPIFRTRQAVTLREEDIEENIQPAYLQEALERFVNDGSGWRLESGNRMGGYCPI